jgi:4a-hydroxytetrahydrobiopterin dehydratase
MIATAFGTGVAQLTYTFDQAAFAATGAGQETTMAQPAKSVLLLSHHPDQWERLVAAPDLVPNAIEELLRAVALGHAGQPRMAREVGAEDLLDPHRRGPALWFQQMDVPRPQRNRIHVDISVPHDQAEARVTAAIAAGGRLVSDRNAPEYWALADAEGNEADVATWLGRE